MDCGETAFEGVSARVAGPGGRVRYRDAWPFAVVLAASPFALCAADAGDAKPWKAETEVTEGNHVRFELNERIRGEFVDWFGDPIVRGRVTERDSDYTFAGNKLQLGIRVRGERFEGFAQFQNSTVAALPSNGVGLGAVYYANTPTTTQNAAFLRQGWLKLRHDGFYVSAGRQLYSDAAQGPARQWNLKWIQETRLAQRLIGPFEYTHTGRSFDGGTVGYLAEDVEIQGFAFMPTSGGFEINGMNTITDINVAGLTANLRDSERFRNTIGQLSYYYYSDDRGLVAADNRPETVRVANRGKPIEIHTLGVWGAHALPIGPGVLDGMLYNYGQFGDWQNLSQGSWAYGAELGYQFNEVWSSPWLRAGINSASGDANPDDRDHQTFFQMLPTAWLYAQFPFYNMMNNQDVFVQALLRPDPTLLVRLDFHWLSVSQSRDLVYSGGGATSNTYFGFNGNPTGGFDDLAYLTHLMVNYKPLDYLAFNLFYSHAFGQSIINAQYTARPGNYGFVEAIVSF
ncbi:alginate export family protein [Methylolobus aquaticus]